MYTTPIKRVFEEKEESVSTNSDLKQKIYSSVCPVFCVLSAKKQSGGRGRLGRTFFSPDGGIYFSVSVPLQGDEKNIPFLTLISGLAVNKALKTLCKCETKIKWPNDIYLNGKKLCGILTELVNSPAGLCAVVGIGINASLKKEDIPDELKNILTSLSQEGFSVDKYRLIENITQNIDKAVYEQKELYETKEETLNEIRKLSFLSDKKVKYLVNGEEKQGIITDITDIGGAVMKTDNGEKIVITSGEIKIHQEN